MKLRHAALLSATIVLASCGLNPVSMRPPELGGPPSFDVVIEFANALNLPAGAKVTYQGSDVGTVRDVRLDNGVVAVHVSLNSSTKIPLDCTAGIVQDTVLGDSYIKMTKPTVDGASPPLTAGARIPVIHTLPPNSIEDMMKTVSSFLGTGSFQQMQHTLRSINATLPKAPAEAHKVASTLAIDLRNLAANSGYLDQSIEAVNRVATTLRDRSDSFRDFTSATSVDFWTKFGYAIGTLIYLLPAVQSIPVNGYWAIPLIDSLANAMEQVGAASGGAFESFANQTLLPFLANPRINVTEVVTPDGQDHTADTQTVLRNLGAIK